MPRPCSRASSLPSCVSVDWVILSYHADSFSRSNRMTPACGVLGIAPKAASVRFGVDDRKQPCRAGVDALAVAPPSPEVSVRYPPDAVEPERSPRVHFSLPLSAGWRAPVDVLDRGDVDVRRHGTRVTLPARTYPVPPPAPPAAALPAGPAISPSRTLRHTTRSPACARDRHLLGPLRCAPSPA